MVLIEIGIEKKRQETLRTFADKGYSFRPYNMGKCLWVLNLKYFQRSMECAHNSNFADNFTMMLNVNTMKDGGLGDNKGGAPQKGFFRKI